AAINIFLEGMGPRRPTARHCQLLGEALANFHLAGADFTMTRPNDLSLSGWRRLFEACRERAHEVSRGLADELARELDLMERQWPRGLATGTIHADLFPDNVFF